MSQQSQINTPKGIDFDLIRDFEKDWKSKGFVQMDSREFIKKIKKGHIAKYITNLHGKLRFVSGGLVMLVEKEYFVYKSGRNFSVQYDNIVMGWLLENSVKPKKVKPIVFNKPDLSKKFISYIDDKPVASFDKLYNQQRFEQTKKYLNALETKNFKIKEC